MGVQERITHSQEWSEMMFNLKLAGTLQIYLRSSQEITPLSQPNQRGKL